MPGISTPTVADERQRVIRLLLFSLLAAASYTMLRSVGDSLFLARVGQEQLAWVFGLAGLCTAVIASSWYVLTRHLPLARSIQISGSLFAVLGWLAWWLLPEWHHATWLLVAIYLLAEIKGCVNAIQIVSAFSSGLGRTASRRSWTVVGLGVPLAAVLVGACLSWPGSPVSLRDWLFVAAALDFATAFMLRGRDLASRTRSTSEGRWSAERGAGERPSRSERIRYWLTLLVGAKVIALTLMTYEWKIAVDRYLASDELLLARYFGTFYAAIGGSTLLLQLLVTRRLLSPRRIHISLFLMPLVLLGVAAVLLGGATGALLLVAATAGKSLEAWRRSVHDTVLNRIYSFVESLFRRQLIVINSAIVKPLGEVAAAVVLLCGPHRWLLLGAIGVWLVAAWRVVRWVRGSYAQRRSLARSARGLAAHSAPGWTVPESDTTWGSRS